MTIPCPEALATSVGTAGSGGRTVVPGCGVGDGADGVEKAGNDGCPPLPGAGYACSGLGVASCGGAAVGGATGSDASAVGDTAVATLAVVFGLGCGAMVIG